MTERRSSSSSSKLAAVPVPATTEDVFREVRAVRSLLDLHVEHCKAEFERSKIRDQALMDLMKEIMTRETSP